MLSAAAVPDERARTAAMRGGRRVLFIETQSV
jgi:hypothetical protein